MVMWNPGWKFVSKMLRIINYSLRAFIWFHCNRERKIWNQVLEEEEEKKKVLNQPNLSDMQNNYVPV